ncbi:MAG TPA: hypothetical protein VIO14_04890 [Dehalococcoidia bacterium]
MSTPEPGPRGRWPAWRAVAPLVLAAAVAAAAVVYAIVRPVELPDDFWSPPEQGQVAAPGP